MNFWTPWNYVQPRLDESWDYKSVLRDTDAILEFNDGVYFIVGHFRTPPLSQAPGWMLYWNKCMVCIGHVDYDVACKGAALYIELYRRGLSHSFCRKLMLGYLTS